MRFLLIDRITEWYPGKSAAAVKSVAMSEDFFQDHFPLNPIMPGVLILEGMAQLAGMVIEEGVRQDEGRKIKALMSIADKVKFRKPVFPGDCLTYRAEVTSVNDVGGSARVRAYRDDKMVSECSLVFIFLEVDNPSLEAKRTEILNLWLRGPKLDA